MGTIAKRAYLFTVDDNFCGCVHTFSKFDTTEMDVASRARKYLVRRYETQIRLAANWLDEACD